MSKCKHDESRDWCVSCNKFKWDEAILEEECQEEQLCFHGHGDPNDPCCFVPRVPSASPDPENTILIVDEAVAWLFEQGLTKAEFGRRVQMVIDETYERAGHDPARTSDILAAYRQFKAKKANMEGS